MSRPPPQPRSAYRCFIPITTRWADNDVYGHVNNVVYYAWFDTAVNGHLIAQGALDIETSPVIGLVVQTQCQYFSPIAFPQRVTAGIRVSHVGTSSVRYEVGLFADDDAQTAAHGHFVHVYVNRATRRPQDLPVQLRNVVMALQADAANPLSTSGDAAAL
jgi:acyl-CoA thioester hydrolase